MKLIEINEKNLLNFIDNIRLEDEKELEYVFKDNYKKRFIDIALELRNDKNSYFLADDNNIPVAIGGASLIYHDEKKTAQVWLLSTKQAYKHRFFLYKYVRDKIALFQQQFDILFNYIYKSNFEALKWLTKAGFKVVELEDKDFKFFYFNKGENKFDI